MNDRDPQAHVDALGRRSAAALRDDVDRRVDVDEALRRTLAGGAGITPMQVSNKTPEVNVLGTRGRAVWFGAAAAVAVVGIGAALVALTGDDPRVVPADVAPTLTLDDVTTVASTPGTTVPPADSTVAAPNTTVADTDVPTTAADSVQPPASDVDALAGLVAPPPIDPIDVPAFLPPAPVADPSQVRLTQFTQPAGSVTALNQVWATPSGRLLHIATHLDTAGWYPTDSAIPVEIAPWDDAVVTGSMSEGFAQLMLLDPSGSMTVWGAGFTSDELSNIVRDMSIVDGRWRLGTDAPADIVQLHVGWGRTTFAASTLQWDTGGERGELIVSLGGPDTIRTPYFVGSTVTVADVGGAPALLTELATGAAVSWSPTPDVVVVLGIEGSRDEVLALARSLEPVAVEDWLASGVLDTSEADGCNSYFFC